MDADLRSLVSAASDSVGGAPNALALLANDAQLLRTFLPFSRSILSDSNLDPRSLELVILRTAWNTGCTYQWSHHLTLGAACGIQPAEVAAIQTGNLAFWSESDRLLVNATDELHACRSVSGFTWQQLGRFLSPAQLVDLCLVVGHYEMLAMLMNTVGLDPE